MRNIRHNIHTLSLAHNTVCKYANGTFSVIVNGTTVTRFPGFNCAINTLGMWNDTTQGTWSLIEATKDSMVVRVSLQLLPMTQTWTFKAVNGELSWHIDAEIEEWLCIEEFRCLCILNPLYQQWTADEYRKTFPRFTATYNLILLGEVRGEFVGVEEYNGKTFLPSFRFYNKDSNLLPLIQNFPAYNRAHAIGFRQEIFSSYSDFEPNMYPLFDGVVKIGKDVDIGKKGPASQGLPHSRSQHVCDDNRSIDRPLRVALVNLPWQRDGKRGIRAGSRWPHISDYSEGDYLPFPFFLAYATSLLQNHGIEAIIIDAIASGMTEEKFIEHIRSLDLDYLVAETSIPSFDYDRALLHRISSVGIPIILCGPVAHMCFEKFLKDHTFISYILCGEYEFTLLGLIRALQQNDDLGKVHGIVYRDGHVFKKTPQRPLCDINLLPWPHRETLPMHLYLDAPGEMLTPSVQILASRGCPFPCQFCLWPQVMYQGRTYRTRDVTNVIDEMEHLVKQQGFRSVYFDDDTFNIGKERMLEFCREIRKRGLEKTQWAIMARADLMDEEILDEMKLSGVWAIKYGVESASQSLVDNIGKSMDLKETEAMIRYTQKLGIRTHLTFTFGLPGETHETIEKTTQWALELNPFSIQFSIMTPFPGTKYYDYLKEKG
ncbi:MAG: radical SAM protein, partial [Candidatus Omnitrophica bacterium]|nr:radical SAM protein [Candidatus Omnitrophota bacterium]